MSEKLNDSRRTLLGTMLALGALGSTQNLVYASAPATRIAVGFVYVGSSKDMGYNQAHANGARAVASLPGIEVHELANVPEGPAAGQALTELVQQKHCRIVFATSYGYFVPHMLEAARNFPDTIFLHAGAVYRPKLHPVNVGSYFAYIDEAQYVNGLVAGRISRSGKLGFVAAKAIPQVLRNVNAFFLGARRANPQVTMQLVFTGEWSNTAKELAALDALLTKQVDVISTHVDAPGALAAAAETRGIGYCGYHFDQTRAAPKQLLTGAEFDWTNLYVDYVQRIAAKQEWPRSVRGGFSSGLLRNTPYGPRVPSEIRAEADHLRNALRTNQDVVFAGPLRNHMGKQVLAAGVRLASSSAELDKLFWLAEGISGELPR